MMLSFDTVWRRWWRNAERDLQSQTATLPVMLSTPTEAPWLAHFDRAGIPRHLKYPTTTLGRILDQSADRFGDTEALLYNDHRWTYRELQAAVNRMAGGLAHLGVRRGERVLLVLPNCPEFVIAFLAIQKLGAVVINAGPLMGRDDLQTVVGMTNPRVAICLDLQAGTLHWACRGSSVEHLVYVSLQAYQSVLKRLGYQVKLWQNRDNGHDKLQHVMLADLLMHAPARPPTVEADPVSIAVLQATGGTTGTLKLAQLTHRSLLANAMQISVWENAKQGQERVFAVLPMFHVYGLSLCLVTSIFTASTIILMTRFNSEEMLELIRKHKPTICPIVPAICDAISNLLEKEQKSDALDTQPLKGSNLRLCISGAAPLSLQTAERFNRLTGATVVEGYGLTEASPVTHAGVPTDVRIGSIGLPMPDTRVRIADMEDLSRDVPPGEAGELLISGPQLMTGYFANPEQTHQVLLADAAGDVWLRTGDVGRMDAEGFFYLLDRKKDMIIRSGMKIFPVRVERVLRMHKSVKDVAVFGRPDPEHTERVAAVIAPAPPADEQEKLADELRALCREHLAPYEVPQDIEFMDQLPRSALGKMLKRELRKGTPPAGAPAVLPDPAGAVPVAKTTTGDIAHVPCSCEGKSAELHRTDAAHLRRAESPETAVPAAGHEGNGNGDGSGHA
jgi:long-chain acyl-CoA synthetase